MQQHDPIVGQRLRDLREKLMVAAGADVLEHSNGHDAVETLGHVSIVLQPKLGARL